MTKARRTHLLHPVREFGSATWGASFDGAPAPAFEPVGLSRQRGALHFSSRHQPCHTVAYRSLRQFGVRSCPGALWKHCSEACEVQLTDHSKACVTLGAGPFCRPTLCSAVISLPTGKARAPRGARNARKRPAARYGNRLDAWPYSSQSEAQIQKRTSPACSAASN